VTRSDTLRADCESVECVGISHYHSTLVTGLITYIKFGRSIEDPKPVEVNEGSLQWHAGRGLIRLGNHQHRVLGLIRVHDRSIGSFKMRMVDLRKWRESALDVYRSVQSNISRRLIRWGQGRRKHPGNLVLATPHIPPLEMTITITCLTKRYGDGFTRMVETSHLYRTRGVAYQKRGRSKHQSGAGKTPIAETSLLRLANLYSGGIYLAVVVGTINSRTSWQLTFAHDYHHPAL